MMSELPSTGDIWAGASAISPKNEADVEHLLVLPLLQALGYAREDIAPKHPVIFREGRRGRKPEADFIVFDGVVHNRTTSLLVVEVKAPGENFDAAREQGESYAYASAVRAPVLLVTDGTRLQVWQLQATTETELVIDVGVAGLAANRAKLEAVLGKESLRAYCRSLLHKRIADVTGGFGPYLDAEFARAKALPGQVPRHIAAGDRVIRSSENLLVEFRNGAVLQAPSGFGKTFLAASVFRDALQERVNDSDLPLPFDLFLPDLIDDEGVIGYLLERVRPHQPAMTADMLDAEFRARGALLVCDGFNRLPANISHRVTSWLRNFQRDYPRSQIFVFSTEGRYPDISLEKVWIKELSRDQQAAVIKLVDATAIHLLYERGEDMDQIRAHPLLLTLLVKGRSGRSAGRRAVLPLFQKWLDRLICGPGDGLVIQGQREAALEAVAIASVSSALTVREALDRLASREVPPAILDDLHERGGVAVRTGGRVEVVHEALADFLRARVIARMPPSEGLEAIRSLPLLRGSWLAKLVLSLLSSSEGRYLLLSQALSKDIIIYADLLDYPLIPSTIPGDQGSFLLRDIRVGGEDLLRRWFPALRGAVVRNLTGQESGSLALMGSHDGEWLTYAWHTIATLGAELVEASPTSGRRWRSLNLSGSRIGPDEGRLLGYQAVHGALAEAILRRDMVGGAVWANERLASDLSIMFSSEAAPPPDNIDDIDALLAPQRDAVLSATDGEGAHYALPISRMLEDSRRLRAVGQSRVDFWWRRLGWKRWMGPHDPAWADLFHEHFRRAQLIYAEIAEASLGEIRPLLGFHNAMPVRFRVRIAPGRIGPAHTTLWHPVPSWDLAGADTERTAVATWPELDLRAHFETVRQQLLHLGRAAGSDDVWVGGSQVRSFDGHTWRGTFDGGTSAVWEACDWIKRDLERVFPRRVR